MSLSAYANMLITAPDWKWKLVRALLVGAVGAVIALWLNVPLAWMLGPMSATLIASIYGASIAVPMKLRSAGIGVLGTYLGSTFTPAMLDHVSEWPVTLAGIVVFVPVVTGLTALFYRYVAKYDTATSLYSAAPGALTPMIVLGSAAGGHEQTIAMTQGLRVMLVVFAAPVVVALIGLDISGNSHSVSGQAISMGDLSLLAACCLAGVLVAKKLKLPAGEMTGAMLVSGALYLGGVVEGALPDWMIDVVLLVMGASVGSRFAGVQRSFLARVALFAVLSVILIMIYSAAMAWLVAMVTGLDYVPVMLALAPGGVAEMCLVAVALGIDPGFVAFHHITRIFAILLLAPVVAMWLTRYQKANAGNPSDRPPNLPN